MVDFMSQYLTLKCKGWVNSFDQQYQMIVME